MTLGSLGINLTQIESHSLGTNSRLYVVDGKEQAGFEEEKNPTLIKSLQQARLR